MGAILLAPVYIIVNIYVVLRSLKWLKVCNGFFRNKWFQSVFCTIYILLSTSLLTAFFLPESNTQRVVKLISNYWLGTFLYILLFVALADISLIIWKKFFKPHAKKKDSRKILAITGGIVCIAVIGMSIYGIVNATNIKVKHYEVQIDKTVEGMEEINVVLVADTHLGYSVGNRMMKQMVEKINVQKPDLVCFAGDFFDNEYAAIRDPEGIIKILQGIQSTYGVYACFGNHDIEEPILAGFTFGSKKEKVNGEEMIAFVKKANITLLRDETVLIDNKFYVAGRRDKHRPGDGSNTRLSPEELLGKLDKTKPIFVIDHEPSELEELADAGVDLDLAGHTHAGQVFPGNLTIHLMWENPWGYLKVKNMHNFVTSGVGVFGPNMRTFTDSEIMNIQIHFN